ncbi:MAG: hydroxymethylbilane synthase [Planctomycetota bacterium]|nr:hydroxymethylbilane synthase [Planctomycetota bacterium]
MSHVIRIGTRGSRLALIQTGGVAERLRAAHPDLDIRIETFRTAGDRDRATPLARLPGIGFFVKDLEAALLEDRIDLAVHSMKDVPTAVPEGLEVGASVPEREDPRDCLVTPEGLRLEDLPQGATVGSSSPRRRAMLLAARPDLEFIGLRGNVETRLRKLGEGACHATILARAGLARMGLLDRRTVVLEPEILMPPAGQGALGLEFRASDDRVRGLVAPLDHPPTRWAVTAERALVARLGAGCRTPLGVLGRVGPDGRLALEAYLVSPEGRDGIRRRADGGAAEAPRLGAALAETLLEAGAGRLIRPDSEGDDA